MLNSMPARVTRATGRLFIGVLCSSAVFPNGTSSQTGKVVLTPQDFEYVGMLRVPAEVTPHGWGSLTFRKADGHLRFFLLGSRTEGDPLFEIDAPAFRLTLDSALRATVIRNWGTPYRKIGSDADGMYWTEDLEWFNGLLYWTYGHYYPVTLVHDPSLGVTDLQATPVVSGPWRTTEHSHLTRGYMTIIPQWYADAYLGGRRLAVGSGGRSGLSGSSWGPVLIATAFPVPGTSTKTNLPSTSLVKHPFEGMDVYQHRATRPANYVANGSPDLPPRKGIGYWTQFDKVESAVWIDLPDKHGVLFFGALGTGNVWYGVNPGPEGWADPCGQWTGPHAQGRQQQWWIYDPMAFVPVIRGKAKTWNPRPTHTFEPNKVIPASRVTSACAEQITGSAFDPATRMLYVLMPEADPEPFGNTGWLPVIHAFHVKSAGGANAPAVALK